MPFDSETPQAPARKAKAARTSTATRAPAAKKPSDTSTDKSGPQRAMEKLGFKTRVDVVRHAASKGWLPDR